MRHKKSAEEQAWLKSFAEKLKEAMDTMGYNQTILACRADLSLSEINKLLNGINTPNGYVIHKLCKVLPVSPTYLMDN